MSESDVIDPSLDDPSMAFLQDLPEPHGSLFDNDDEELPPSPSLGIHSQSLSQESSVLVGPGTQAPGSRPSFDFPEICHLVKKRKHLTLESEAELDRFCVPVRVY
jgi:hypothetical protein